MTLSMVGHGHRRPASPVGRQRCGHIVRHPSDCRFAGIGEQRRNIDMNCADRRDASERALDRRRCAKDKSAKGAECGKPGQSECRHEYDLSWDDTPHKPCSMRPIRGAAAAAPAPGH
jgi:hypothetical protein